MALPILILQSDDFSFYHHVNQRLTYILLNSCHNTRELREKKIASHLDLNSFLILICDI